MLLFLGLGDWLPSPPGCSRSCSPGPARGPARACHRRALVRQLWNCVKGCTSDGVPRPSAEPFPIHSALSLPVTQLLDERAADRRGPILPFPSPSPINHPVPQHTQSPFLPQSGRPRRAGCGPPRRSPAQTPSPPAARPPGLGAAWGWQRQQQEGQRPPCPCCRYPSPARCCSCRCAR